MSRKLLTSLLVLAACVASADPRPAATIPASKVITSGFTSTDLQTNFDKGEIPSIRVSGSCSTETAGVANEICIQGAAIYVCSAVWPSACNASGWVLTTASGGGGSGDITSVGSCATGACQTPLTFTSADPDIILQDSDFSGVNFKINTANTGTNEGHWQLLSQTGAAGLNAMVSQHPFGVLHAPTLYLGGGETEGTTPPTNAIRVDKNGGMQAIGSQAFIYADKLNGPIDGDATNQLAWDTFAGTWFIDKNGSGYWESGEELCTNDGTCGTPGSGSSGNTSITFSPNDFKCFASAGCTTATIDGTGVSFDTRDFVNGASQSGSAHFIVPPNWTTQVLTVTIDWVSDDATCNGEAANDDVCWTWDSGSSGNDVAFIAPTLGGTANGVTSVCTNNGRVTRATRTGYIHGMVSGEHGQFVLTRNTAAGPPTGCTSQDSFGKPAHLLSVTLTPE